jgi:hypothetical protein
MRRRKRDEEEWPCRMGGVILPFWGPLFRALGFWLLVMAGFVLPWAYGLYAAAYELVRLIH